jgi:hypothetical protein
MRFPDSGGARVISNKVCQLCGDDIEEGLVRFLPELGDIPFCITCKNKIKRHQRRKKIIQLDTEKWKIMHESPIKLLFDMPSGRPAKELRYWPKDLRQKNIESGTI